MIPLLHDLRGQRVLVFGGGRVGARRARRFAAEARVVVISPAFADRRFAPDERRHPDAGVALVRAAPGPDDLETWFERADPALAVAATDDADVNAAVARTARERGVLVNRADRGGSREPAPGRVDVPATVRDGPVVVSVSTGGRAPALSGHLRERLADELAGAGEMAALLGAVREDLRSRDVAPETRREAVRAVAADERVWKDLGTPGANARRTADDVVDDVVGETE